jgi:hypothetical protein
MSQFKPEAMPASVVGKVEGKIAYYLRVNKIKPHDTDVPNNFVDIGS